MSGSSDEDRLEGTPDAERPREDTQPLGAETASPQGSINPGEPPEAWVGRMLGRYQIKSLLGRGGMGVVYRATDPGLEREVAIKMLYLDREEDSASLQRFLREARAAARLRNDHAVSVFEVGQLDELHYIVMEFVEGGSLADRLKRGALPADEARGMVAQACRGLVAAHEQGLIHRDIKPGNLLVADNGTVRIADFGLVKRLNSESMAVTQQGQMMGSPYYMSPEQFAGEDVDHRSDIYSLGATFYALLTGKHPYEDSQSIPQVIYAHLHKEVPNPSAAVSSVPQRDAAVILRAMAKSPDDRYQTAAEMLTDLGEREVVPGAGVQSPMRNRRPWLLMSGLAVVFLVLAAVFLRGTSRSGPPRVGERPSGAAAVPVAPSELADPIRIGAVYSASGDTSQQESDIVGAIEFAVAELNESGGLLGRPVELIKADAPEWEAADLESRRMITGDLAKVLFGGSTAPLRKTLATVAEELNSLLICPGRFGGLEQSAHVVYLGAIPNQQLIPVVQWAINEKAKRRFYLVGTEEYEFPHIANLIFREAIKDAGGEVVGETYVPPGNHGIGFAKGTVEAMLASGADVILSTLRAESNIGFYRALRAEGLSADGVMSIAFDMDEHVLKLIELEAPGEDYAASGYFQSIRTEENLQFIARFREHTGPAIVVTDTVATAYAGVHLWATAVRAAGSVEPIDVTKHLPAGPFPGGPLGEIKIDPDNQHAYRTPMIGRISADRSFGVIWQAPEAIKPDPFPWDTAEEWRAILEGFGDASWRFQVGE